MSENHAATAENGLPECEASASCGPDDHTYSWPCDYAPGTGTRAVDYDAPRFRSRDGLLSSSDPAAVALWEDITARAEFSKMSWTDILRARGVKYAHPDDGWVDREHNRHTRSWYPQFDDRPEVGDLMAFGSPPDGDHYQSWHDVWRGRKDRYAREQMARLEGKPESSANGYRICRVTKVERRSGILGYHQSFEYEDTGERMPPRKPTFWQRLRTRVIPPAEPAPSDGGAR